MSEELTSWAERIDRIARKQRQRIAELEAALRGARRKALEDAATYFEGLDLSIPMTKQNWPLSEVSQTLRRMAKGGT